MAPPIQAPQSVIAGQSYAMETFAARRALGTTLAVGTKWTFFQDHTPSATEFNDLGVLGVLPSNKGGAVTGLFMRRADVYNDGAIMTAAKAEANNFYWLEFLDAARVRVFVNNTLLVQHRLWALPAAAPLIGGQTSLATTAMMTAENAGPLLSHFELELPSQIPIRVEVDLTRTISQAPTANCCYLTAGFQAKTSTLFTARTN